MKERNKGKKIVLRSKSKALSRAHFLKTKLVGQVHWMLAKSLYLSQSIWERANGLEI